MIILGRTPLPPGPGNQPRHRQADRQPAALWWLPRTPSANRIRQIRHRRSEPVDLPRKTVRRRQVCGGSSDEHEPGAAGFLRLRRGRHHHRRGPRHPGSRATRSTPRSKSTRSPTWAPCASVCAAFSPPWDWAPKPQRDAGPKSRIRALRLLPAAETIGALSAGGCTPGMTRGRALCLLPAQKTDSLVSAGLHKVRVVSSYTVAGDLQ